MLIFILHARLRVLTGHPAFPAPSTIEGHCSCKARAPSRRENARTRVPPLFEIRIRCVPSNEIAPSDLPPEKRKKIVEALHRLSIKYKPYVEALSGNDAAVAATDR